MKSMLVLVLLIASMFAQPAPNQCSYYSQPAQREPLLPCRSWRKIQAGDFEALACAKRNKEFIEDERANSVMKRIFNVSTGMFLPTMLAVAWAITCGAREPEHFVPANVANAGSIPGQLSAAIEASGRQIDRAHNCTGMVGKEHLACSLRCFNLGGAPLSKLTVSRIVRIDLEALV
jgi:hypothetical protein